MNIRTNLLKLSLLVSSVFLVANVHAGYFKQERARITREDGTWNMDAFYNCFRYACTEGKHLNIYDLLEYEPEPLPLVNCDNGMNLLHLVALGEKDSCDFDTICRPSVIDALLECDHDIDPEYVKEQVEHQAKYINMADKSGNTPLHLAATHEKLELFKHFLLRGANPDLKDNEEKTPRFYAEKNGWDLDKFELDSVNDGVGGMSIE